MARATIVAGSATIADAALTAGAATLLTPNTGVALPGSTVVGTFTDANTFATTADFTASIDWGDGAPRAPASLSPPPPPACSTSREAITTPNRRLHDPRDRLRRRRLEGRRHRLGDRHRPPGHRRTKNFTATEGDNTGLFVLATFTTPTLWRRSPTSMRRSRSAAGATVRRPPPASRSSSSRSASRR